MFWAEIWKYQNFYLKIFIFLVVKFSICWNRRVFVMSSFTNKRLWTKTYIFQHIQFDIVKRVHFLWLLYLFFVCLFLLVFGVWCWSDCISSYILIFTLHCTAYYVLFSVSRIQWNNTVVVLSKVYTYFDSPRLKMLRYFPLVLIS